MLIRSLIQDTLSLQGFRVKFINRYNFGIINPANNYSQKDIFMI